MIRLAAGFILGWLANAGFREFRYWQFVNEVEAEEKDDAPAVEEAPWTKDPVLERVWTPYESPLQRRLREPPYRLL